MAIQVNQNALNLTNKKRSRLEDSESCKTGSDSSTPFRCQPAGHLAQSLPHRFSDRE